MASFVLGQWHAGASRRGFASTIATILLMLHWAAPRLLPLEIGIPSGSTKPAFTSGASITQPGNLPRAVARPLAFEAAQPKPPRHGWGAGSKLEALATGVHWALPPVCAFLIVGARFVIPASPPANAFYARGPPSTV